MTPEKGDPQVENRWIRGSAAGCHSISVSTDWGGYCYHSSAEEEMHSQPGRWGGALARSSPEPASEPLRLRSPPINGDNNSVCLMGMWR